MQELVLGVVFCGSKGGLLLPLILWLGGRRYICGWTELRIEALACGRAPILKSALAV